MLSMTWFLCFSFSKKIFLVQTSFISAERPMIEFKLLCIHAMNTVEVTDSKVNESANLKNSLSQTRHYL